MQKTKVLITFVEAGLGHIVTAKSIAENLKKLYSDKLDVIEDYCYRDSEDKRLVDYEKFLVEQVKKTNRNKVNAEMQFASMAFFGDRLSLFLANDVYFNKIKKAILQHFKEKDPDVIISTHFSTSYYARCYRDKFKKSCRVITYNPDPNVHGWWDRENDLFIVNNPAALTEAIKKRKFEPERVREVPFITREDIINCNLTKTEAREKHNLPLDKFTVLLADGAYAESKLAPFTDELLKSEKEMVILPAVCKNEKLMEKYSALADKQPANIVLRPIGFRMDLFEFYKAADVVITKAGPNAILDCGFMGTPIIVNYCASPVERATRDLFVNKYGIGENIENAAICREHIEELVDNPEHLKPFIENCTKIFDQNNDGGKAVAHTILNLINSN